MPSVVDPAASATSAQFPEGSQDPSAEHSSQQGTVPAQGYGRPGYNNGGSPAGGLGGYGFGGQQGMGGFRGGAGGGQQLHQQGYGGGGGYGYPQFSGMNMVSRAGWGEELAGNFCLLPCFFVAWPSEVGGCLFGELRFAEEGELCTLYMR